MKKLFSLAAFALLLSNVTLANVVTVEFKTSERVLSMTSTFQKEHIDFHVERMLDEVGNFISYQGYEPFGAPFTRTLRETATTYTVQAGYPVAPSFPEVKFGTIITKYLPAGKVATAMHVGPFSELASTYLAITNFMFLNGYQSVGAPWEYYLDDPSEVPELELRTRIVWPVSSIAP